MVGWNLRHLSKRAQTSAANHAIRIVQERLEQYLIGLKTIDFYIEDKHKYQWIYIYQGMCQVNESNSTSVISHIICTLCKTSKTQMRMKWNQSFGQFVCMSVCLSVCQTVKSVSQLVKIKKIKKDILFV